MASHMVFLIAESFEDTFLRLLPWLVPVLIAVVGGAGRIMSYLMERRVEKMRRFEAEGGMTKAPSVQRSKQPRDRHGRETKPRDGRESRDNRDREGRESPAPKERPTILEQIRRYMEMMEERSIGPPEDHPGRTGEPRRRRPSELGAPEGSAPESMDPPVPPGVDAPRPVQPPAQPREVLERRRLQRDREIAAARKAALESERGLTKLHTPQSADDHRGIAEDPFGSRRRRAELAGKKVRRVRLVKDRHAVRQAIVMAEILGPPLASRPNGEPILPPRRD